MWHLEVSQHRSGSTEVPAWMSFIVEATFAELHMPRERHQKKSHTQTMRIPAVAVVPQRTQERMIYAEDDGGGCTSSLASSRTFAKLTELFADSSEFSSQMAAAQATSMKSMELLLSTGNGHETYKFKLISSPNRLMDYSRISH